MSLDLLFCAHNRLAYTRQSFEALLANTQWDLVERLCIADDASEDGTELYLLDAAWRAPCERIINDEPLGGPVAAMNWYLSLPRGPEQFAKVDNDVIVPPGWLGDMWACLQANPELDVLGMQARGGPKACPAPRGYDPARHIGGVGLIRRRIFNICRPQPSGRFGWTEWQEQHSQVTKAWLTPSLPCFELDRMPESAGPWQALARVYEEQGWQRMWGEYSEDSHVYWDWWEPAE